MNPEQNPKNTEQLGQEQAEQAPKSPETPEELKAQIDAQKHQFQKELQDTLKRGQEWAAKQKDPDTDPSLVKNTQAELDTLGNEAQTDVAEADKKLDVLKESNDQQKFKSVEKLDLSPDEYYIGAKKNPDGTWDLSGALKGKFTAEEIIQRENRERKEKEAFEKRLIIHESVKPGTADYLWYQVQNEKTLIEHDREQTALKRGKSKYFSTDEQKKIDNANLQQTIIEEMTSLIKKGPFDGKAPDKMSQVDFEIGGIYKRLNEVDKKALREGNIPIDILSDVILAFDDEVQDQLDKVQSGEDDPYVNVKGEYYSSEKASVAAETLLSKIKRNDVDLNSQPSPTQESNSNADPKSTEVDKKNENAKPLSIKETTENFNANEKLIRYITSTTIPDLIKIIPDIKNDNDFKFLGDSIEEDLSRLEGLAKTDSSEKIFASLTKIMQTCKNPNTSFEDKINYSKGELGTLMSTLNNELNIHLTESNPGDSYDHRKQKAIEVIETNNPALDQKIAKAGKVGIYIDAQPVNDKGEPQEARQWLLSPEPVVIYRYKKPAEPAQNATKSNG